MRKKQLLLMACACMFVFTGCKSKEKIDLSSTHTTPAATEVSKESMPETTPAETTKAPAVTATAKAKLEVYKNNNISIEYPIVSNLSDETTQEKVNTLLKDNALSYIKANELDESTHTLTIKAKVVSINRKRIVVTYQGISSKEGASDPVNVFYTNTIDLDTVNNIGLNDYADAYTVAGYIASGDYKLAEISGDLEKSVREYINDSKNNVDTYYKMLSEADFTSGTADTFPQVFSYEEQGVIYVSIPAPHALGDYVLIKYLPDNK